MASNFPATSIDSFTNKVDGTDYPSAAHVNDLQMAVVAVQEKVGVDGSAVTSTHDYKLSLVTSSAKAISNASIIDEDTMVSNLDTKLPTQQSVKAYVDASIAAAKAALFPVGCIYTTVTATNPATVLGFGTWAAWGVGKVPATGVDTNDAAFNTVEKTGGAATVSIAHTHAGADHLHGFSGSTGTTSADREIDDGNDHHVCKSDHTHTFSGTTGAADRALTTGAMSANATPSVLQPYITCYFFKRTA